MKVNEGSSRAKGRLLKPAHELAKAVEDAISAKDAVVAVVQSTIDWEVLGRIQCKIGSMNYAEVVYRGAEELNIDDTILVRKIGRGPTQRWVFAGWLWGPAGGGQGTITPTLKLGCIPAHASTHEDGGSDEVNVDGLSGDLADPQDPKAHKSSHQDGGSDEINVAGLSGELADAQTAKAHASSHQDGGADEISVQGLSGDLADAQDPKTHGSSHQNGGGDEISVAGLNGVLADQQDADKIKGVDVIDTAIGDGKVLVYRTSTGDLGYEAQAGGSGADEKVKVSSDDTTADYLINKLTAGGPITLTEIGGGGNEDLQVSYARGNIKWVTKSGGDYSTVTAALAAITDASATNRYAIIVGPDVGTEQVTPKSYVDIHGFGTRNPSSSAAGAGLHIICSGASPAVDVCVSNMHLGGDVSGGADGVCVAAGSNVDFHHCRIYGQANTAGQVIHVTGGTARFFGCEGVISNAGGGPCISNLVSGGTVDFYNCRLYSDQGRGSTGDGSTLYVTGGIVNLHQGTTLAAAGSGAYAIENTGGTVNVFEASYDPDDTSGTITGADKDVVVGDLTVIDDLMLNGISHGDAEPFDGHSNNPTARAYRNAVQAIATGAWPPTYISFTTERWDNDDIWAIGSPTRLTCKTAGYYLILWSLEWAANATGVRTAAVMVNGATLIEADSRPNLGASTVAMAGSTLYPLAVNDYVELGVMQTSGGNLNVLSTSAYTPEFMMVRVA